jgi:aldose 1-epimerase
MAFAVQTHQAPGVTGLDATIYALEDGAGGRAEVWPALGFNCYRWQAVRGGQALELLYAAPDLFADGRPTRSGIPVLFPFPNRIRDGLFRWGDRNYSLPPNDPVKKNAIHGFACRRPWRVVDQGADGDGAWLTGEFHGARDAADCRDLWPADYVLRVTYRLGRNTLRIEAAVGNPDSKPLPFGLGYHPYFRLPFTGGVLADDCTVAVPAAAYWELKDSLPTGERLPVDRARDLNVPRRYADLQLDDVLTELRQDPPLEGGLHERAVVVGVADGTAVRVLCSPEFREMVVFTPPHRQAFCAEPYTCVTDAVNLQQSGIDAGWLTLAPGGRWSAVVELRV